MEAIRLIATDLDGTLVGPDDDHDLYVAFREQVNDLRRRHDAVWVVCTGRSLSSFRRAFVLMEHWDIQPDFVIVRHAYIYRVARGRYLPSLLWNLRMKRNLRAHSRQMRHTLREWHTLICDRFDNVATVALEERRLCMQFLNPRSAAEAAKILREKSKGHVLLTVFQYQAEVDVRVVPSTKGLALRELAQHLGVGPENTLAIGDGHNDLALLDPEVVALTACPSNAAREVAELVSERGGHVARAPGLAGVMEALHAYATDTVNARLPKDWKRATDAMNPIGVAQAPPLPGHSRHSEHRRTQRFQAAILIGAGGYMTVLVFAYFRLLPGSQFILWPYEALIKLAARISLWFA